MEIITYSLLYLTIGLSTVMGIVFFNDIFLKLMYWTMLRIKSAQLKLNISQNKNQPQESQFKEFKEKQTEYLAHLDNELTEEGFKSQNNPKRFYIHITTLTLGWPFIFFIIVMAFLLEVFFLDKKDLE